MHRFRILLFGAVLAAVCLGPATSQAIKIIAPLDRSVVKKDFVVVHGTAWKDSEVAWSVTGATGSDSGVAKADWGDVFELFIVLSPGLNRLKIANQALEVFFDPDGKAAPSGFALQELHAGDLSRCEDCHEFVSMRIKGGGHPEVCLGCHMVESQNPRNTTPARTEAHFRTAVAQCSRCHEPHVSKTPKLLKETTGRLCGTCHEPQARRAGVHRTMGKGECSACHDPHYSGYAKELREPLPGVCLKCHTQGAGVEAARAHPPLASKESCVTCHDPHGADARLLRAGGKAPCSGCHASLSSKGHREKLAACTGCHDPHMARGTGLIKGDVSALCRDCHRQVGVGKTVHEALKKGCQACHDPHANDDLSGARSSCTRCHDPKKSRNFATIHGDLDLPPRSCVECHPAHASDREKLVRAELHFPLTQGKCSVCHGGGEGRSVVVDNAGRRCRMCHPFEKEMLAKGARLHRPVSSGECTACHDPHMSKNKAFLRVAGNALCATCHKKLAKHHLLDPKRAAKYPGSQSFPLDGQELACLGCHRAHGSGEGKLLAGPKRQLCSACHALKK